MKIVCDNCSTKYSIADEKVSGKVFKIKCKKCGHIIVVKGAEQPAAAAPQGGFDQKETRVFDYGGFDGQGEAVWHLVIDREQVGPLGPAELMQKWQAGEIDGETYAWKEGFGDWQRIAAIPELGFLLQGGAPAAGGGGEAAAAMAAAAAPAADPGGLFGTSDPGAVTGRADPADLFAAAGAGGGEDDGGGGGDLFGGSAPAGDFAAPAAAAPARRSVPKDDLFGGAPGGDGMGMGMGAAPAPASSGGGGAGMTGQRNENSVLFSLNNLAALASEGPSKSSGGTGPSPAFQSGGGSEGSGLIDIRAMAAMTLGGKPGDAAAGGPKAAAAVDDLPVFNAGGGFGAPAAGVLLPTAQRGGPNKLVYILIGVIGLMVVALGVILVVVLSGNKNTTTTAAGPQQGGEVAKPSGNETPPGGNETPPGGNETPPGGDETPPPGGNEGAVAGSNDGAGTPGGEEKDDPKKPPKEKGSDAKRPPKERVEDRPPPPKEEKKPPPKEEKCDELSCAVDPSMACCKPTKKGGGETKKGSDPNLPDSLSTGDIKDGIATVRGRVMACNDQYKQSGKVEVKFSVNGDGKVTSATVVGKFAGTPVAGCVEKAVKNAKFKKWKGPSVSVKYPFTFQ